MSEKYPLKELIHQFLNSSHGGADRLRATNVYEMSTTMKSMKQFVDAGVRNFCRTNGIELPRHLPSALTLRRQGLPPDKKNKSSVYYKSEIPFKRAPRNVDLSREHPDFHYSAANVLVHLELSSHFRDEILMMSVDNKNKIILGAPAVHASRRPEGMFLATNMPQMPDHDFPEEDGKITPFGYMTVSCHREGDFRDKLFRSRHESLPQDKPPIRYNTNTKARQHCTNAITL